MDNVKILEVKQSIFASNDEQAAQLRQSLKEKKIFLLNLMSAPGSGKMLLETMKSHRSSQAVPAANGWKCSTL